MEERENSRKVTKGIVVSNKADKTITVKVERLLPHPFYGKYFKRTSKFMAHDAENTCNEGDFVSIIECRRFSKNKCWRLLEVIQRKA